MRVEVTAQARLHFGFLDLSGRGRRRFGGVGLAIARPRVHLVIERGAALGVVGQQARRIEELAARFYAATGLPRGAVIRVEEAIPAHVGLGSGTATALALASALATLHGLDPSPASLCAMMGRGRRSGIGFHAFARGGLLIDGGHASGAEPGSPPPLLSRHEFPEDWPVLLVIPGASKRMSGRDEEEAFLRLPPAPEETAGRMAHVVLMRLLPALAERDLPSFGAALGEAQAIVGGWFASVQDGVFHPGGTRLALRLQEAGALGVGQSSWGPALYAMPRDRSEHERLRSIAQATDPDAAILSVRGFNRGAVLECR